MATKAVTKQEPAAGLPDLAPTRPEDFSIDARDIQPPRLKVASPTTGAAANGNVPVYSLFSEKGSDDAEPKVLVAPGDTDGVVVHVLRMYKTWAANVDPSNWAVEQSQGGELRRWHSLEEAPAFVKANVAGGGTKYTQYNYVCYVPASDDNDLPHNLLLAKTSTPAARTINTLLAQRQGDGVSIITQAFVLWPEKREQTRDGQTNRWSVFKAKPAQAKPEDVQAASELLGMISTKVTNLDQETESAASEPAPAI